MSIKHDEERKTSMPIGEVGSILKKQVGSQVYYYGTVSSDKIKGITFVPVVEPSKKTYVQEQSTDGYQRPGSRSRMRLFMNYLKENPDAVVPPILLSGRDQWQFQPLDRDTSYGKLIVHSPAAIMDGQHRVGGYIALFEEENQTRPVDFILLEGLTREIEVSQFTTVNSTQKGVPKPLYAWLSDEESARIAWALSEEDDSPFKGKITRVGMAPEHLFALHSVAKQVERTFDHGKLRDLDEETKIEFMKRYWTIISDELDEEWEDIRKLDGGDSGGRKAFQFKLLELTGLIAWSRMGPEILGRSYVEGVGMNWDNVAALVSACGHIDWRKDGQYAGRTGEAGGPVLVHEMQRMMPPDASASGNQQDTE